MILGDGGVILGLVPINTEDNVLHLVIGVVGIVAGGMAGSAVRPSVERA